MAWRSWRPDCRWATSGTRRSTISRVMAMAKTASPKNRIRSYSISPALARTRRRLEGAAMGGVYPPAHGPQSPPAAVLWERRDVIHQGRIDPSGARWLDDSPDLSRQDSTGQHVPD